MKQASSAGERVCVGFVCEGLEETDLLRINTPGRPALTGDQYLPLIKLW